MFTSIFGFFTEIFDSIVNPIFSFSLDGVSLYGWAFVVFLGCCLCRFVLPLLGLDGVSGLSVRSNRERMVARRDVMRRSENYRRGGEAYRDGMRSRYGR